DQRRPAVKTGGAARVDDSARGQRIEVGRLGWPGRDAPDPAGAVFREPEVAIGAGRDAEWEPAGGKLRDDAEWGDPAYLVAVIFREPQVPVGAGRDEDRARV